MTTLNFGLDLRNDIDELHLYGCIIANRCKYSEMERLCAESGAFFAGTVAQTRRPELDTYNQQTFVVAYVTKPVDFGGHANMLFACPCTGTYLLYDPWGGRRAAQYIPKHQEDVKSIALHMHELLKTSFVPTPSFTFHNVLRACPLVGPQNRQIEQYNHLKVEKDQEGAGLCVLWTLLFMRALLSSTTPVTVERFVQVQSILASSVLKGVGMKRLAEYCQELLERYGYPSNTDIREYHEGEGELIPKRMTAEQKRMLVPRYNDPFDMETTMSLAKKVALRSFGGPTIPRDFEVSVGGVSHDMRQVFIEWCIPRTDEAASKEWLPGAVKVRSGMFGMFQTPLSPEALQRTTWTLACSALNLMPVPGVFYTMAYSSPLVMPFILKTVAKCTVRLRGIERETQYALLPEVEWVRRQQDHLRELRQWQTRPVRHTEDGRRAGDFVGEMVAASFIPLGVLAGFLSGGLLLPAVVGAAGGAIGGGAGWHHAHQFDIEMDRRDRPKAPNRGAFNRQVTINKERHAAAVDIHLFVRMKCIIHLLLLVLNVRLAGLPPNLRRRSDFTGRVAAAVAKDNRDGRLKDMLLEVRRCRSEIEAMDDVQLGCIATALCKMIIFPASVTRTTERVIETVNEATGRQIWV